jgi:hypothetical protein
MKILNYFFQNKLELDFLVAIEWNVYVSVSDFQKMTSNLETAIATRQVNARGWTTYTDLIVLSRNLHLQKLWTLLAECTFKVSSIRQSEIDLNLILFSLELVILNK